MIHPARRLRATAVALAAAAAAVALWTGAGAALGAPSPIASIQDDRLSLANIDPAPRLRLMARLGAQVVRVDLRWDRVATRRPADPRNPADPAYDWRHYDEVVANARADGVSLLFTVWGTPSWAADRTVPPSAVYPAFATRPARPEDLGDFAAAAAARYAPLGVHLWEAWNEPNIPLFLRPQYVRQGARWVAISPTTYSRMLTSFYRAVKSVDPSATVAGPVTAPVGDACPSTCPASPDSRVTPLAFLAGLNAPGNRPPLDVYSHHPYPITPPRETTFAGATYIDLYNLGRLETAIDHTYLRGKRLWLTEVGFATRPTSEYPTWFSQPLQARYLADAYRRVRIDHRVALLTWFDLQDSQVWASGLLRQNGSPKPAAAAFSLPVAPVTSSPVPRRHAVRIVGQVRPAAAATGVVLQQRLGGRWRAIRRISTAPDGSFGATLRARTDATYRARWSGPARSGGQMSLVSPAFTIQVTG
jgi:hypothetical protein